jgi:hypothetical protein
MHIASAEIKKIWSSKLYHRTYFASIAGVSRLTSAGVTIDSVDACSTILTRWTWALVNICMHNKSQYTRLAHIVCLTIVGKMTCIQNNCQMARKVRIEDASAWQSLNGLSSDTFRPYTIADCYWKYYPSIRMACFNEDYNLWNVRKWTTNQESKGYIWQVSYPSHKRVRFPECSCWENQ